MIGSALYMPRGEEHCVRTEPLDEDILRETHSGITIRPLEALRVIRLFGQHRPDFSLLPAADRPLGNTRPAPTPDRFPRYIFIDEYVVGRILTNERIR